MNPFQMVSRTDDFWAYSRPVVVLIAIANLLPLLGLLAFGWDMIDLLVVYWLEGGVAIIVGFVKTGPARLVTLPLPDSQHKPSIQIKRGSINIGGLPFYARNGPLLVFLLAALGVWLVTGVLAFYRATSPFAYSTTTLPTVVTVAGLLAVSHLITIRPYFDERRYRRTTPPETAAPSLAYVFGVASLVVVLADLTDHPLNLSWLMSFPIAIVTGKIVLELLTRCRNRFRFEQISTDTDPFTLDRSFRQRISPKQLTAELPSVSRPDTWPQLTVQPTRLGIIVESPFVGLENRVFGTWFGLLFAFAIAIVILGGSWSFALILGGTAWGGLTLCGLAISYPRNATLEYEFYDDRLVCYDRWLQQPQWELPYAEIDQVSSTHSRVGQLVGYSTVSIGTSDGMPAKLPYLSDGEEVVARLGRIAHIEVH